MKKFFALALAVAMIMSMAAVSFAADAAPTEAFVDQEAFVASDYSSDSNKLTLNGSFEYGDTVYFPLVVDGEWLSEYRDVEKLKVKVNYEMGGELVQSVSILKKYVDYVAESTAKNAPTEDVEDYKYFVAVKTVKKQTTADADIVGTFTFNRKADTKKEDNKILKIDDCEIDFEINLFYDNVWYTWNDSGVYVESVVDGKNDVNIKWDTEYALKFSYDDEVDFTFGKEPNEGTFTVDVSGQGKLYLEYNTKANDAIVDANPGVKMHFVNFNGAKFNRTGEFAYEMEDGVACYKVVGDKLVAIPGAEYDESDETFYFNTRVLESYVFASAELVNPVAEAPVVEAPVAAPSNPSTGA